MSAWAVTMGAGATMGSCMRPLPFHAGGRRGPESITWTPAMAKYNSRAPSWHFRPSIEMSEPPSTKPVELQLVWTTKHHSSPFMHFAIDTFEKEVDLLQVTFY